MSTKIHTYEGDAVRVTYDVRKCIHAAACIRGQPAVFEAGRRPWIDANAADADEVVAVVARCPSGALQAERLDGGAGEAPDDRNTVSVDPGGPLLLRGRIEVRDPEGALLYAGSRVALCRCGGSENKPFCDGSHSRIGFSDSGQLGEGGVRMADHASPDLVVTPSDRGPYLLSGPFEVVEASGSDRREGGKAAFCRCGHSANKPFCDGSHRRIGFTG